MWGKPGKGTQKGKENAKFFSALTYVFLSVLFFNHIH